MEWEGPDILFVGFQEIQELNAVNVVSGGVLDSVHAWDAALRCGLNQEPMPEAYRIGQVQTCQHFCSCFPVHLFFFHFFFLYIVVLFCPLLSRCPSILRLIISRLVFFLKPDRQKASTCSVVRRCAVLPFLPLIPLDPMGMAIDAHAYNALCARCPTSPASTESQWQWRLLFSGAVGCIFCKSNGS
jgi:hypothetical protein